MQPTEILSNEHRVIEQALSGLEGIAVQVERQGAVDWADAASAVDFIRAFADKFHHAKEEDLLFAQLEEVGFSRQAGPIAVMLHEHDLGRAHVREMADAIDEASRGNRQSIASFRRHALEYVRLLRAHIHKEDQILYPMADEALSAATQSTLLADFAQAEARLGGLQVRDKYAELASRLFGRYGAHAGSSPQNAGVACGHCG
jgi:hemerythrin-like domain-containing protein